MTKADAFIKYNISVLFVEASFASTKITKKLLIRGHKSHHVNPRGIEIALVMQSVFTICLRVWIDEKALYTLKN